MLTTHIHRTEFIKTDLPTNIYFRNGVFVYTNTKPFVKESKTLYGVHLYVTSLDQEIVDGDWFINNDGVWLCSNGIIPSGLNPRKIIATTNESCHRVTKKITNRDITKIIHLNNNNNSMIHVTCHMFPNGLIPKSYDGFIECMLPPISFGVGFEPTIKQVAIVTNIKKQYNNWLKKNKQSDTNYYFVRSINDCVGREFHRVELIEGNEEVKDLLELIDYIGQFCSIEEEDGKDYIYEATYNGCIHESSWSTISIHKTKLGAIKAMNEHKDEEHKKFLKYNKECLKSDPDFFKEFPNKFGEHQDWRIRRTELKE
jgi:hypothetical protein